MSCGSQNISVAMEDDQSDTILSRDPGASEGLRLSILEALKQEKPSRVSCLYIFGKGV